MRGKRARRERREALPPDLKQESRDLIIAAAAIRRKKEDDARKKYATVEEVARRHRNREMAEALAEYRSVRERIIEEAHRQADERKTEEAAA